MKSSYPIPNNPPIINTMAENPTPTPQQPIRADLAQAAEARAVQANREILKRRENYERMHNLRDDFWMHPGTGSEFPRPKRLEDYLKEQINHRRPKSATDPGARAEGPLDASGNPLKLTDDYVSSLEILPLYAGIHAGELEGLVTSRVILETLTRWEKEKKLSIDYDAKGMALSLRFTQPDAAKPVAHDVLLKQFQNDCERFRGQALESIALSWIGTGKEQFLASGNGLDSAAMMKLLQSAASGERKAYEGLRPGFQATLEKCLSSSLEGMKNDSASADHNTRLSYFLRYMGTEEQKKAGTLFSDTLGSLTYNEAGGRGWIYFQEKNLKAPLLVPGTAKSLAQSDLTELSKKLFPNGIPQEPESVPSAPAPGSIAKPPASLPGNTPEKQQEATRPEAGVKPAPTPPPPAPVPKKEPEKPAEEEKKSPQKQPEKPSATSTPTPAPSAQGGTETMSWVAGIGGALLLALGALMFGAGAVIALLLVPIGALAGIAGKKYFTGEPAPAPSAPLAATPAPSPVPAAPASDPKAINNALLQYNKGHTPTTPAGGGPNPGSLPSVRQQPGQQTQPRP